MSEKPEQEFGPWNPGLKSTIPDRLMSRVTLFDPRWSFVEWARARELSEITGMKSHELSIIRPERLALHSVLIRVNSQLYIPDGPNYADLGIELREMAQSIYDGFVIPEMDMIHAAYDAVGREAEETVDRLLHQHVYHVTRIEESGSGGWLSKWFEKKQETTAILEPVDQARKMAAEWRDSRNEDVETASQRAIARILNRILVKRGALHVDRHIITDIAVGLVLNRLGSAAVGRSVQQLFEKAVDQLGYRRLPTQDHPVVLNTKGASASGKSTIRSAQREIAAKAGYDWRDFAIISPDYWRKALIDYDGLGDDYKYAAMLCGQELEVIDRKLDILMAVKGREGTVPHMLIDRFRFDSFLKDEDHAETSSLLTRFGARVFLFFMVTPPAATVDRAWIRGLETGRYKAVDDLLYHNIEAYTGMPDLFFRWASSHSKWVHYEFLDNSVARGEKPQTIACGLNGTLVVYDLPKLMDIDRYKEVNLEAGCSEEVPAKILSDRDATVFLRRAIKNLSRVDVLVPGTLDIFARSVNGRVTVDRSKMPEHLSTDIFGAFDTTDSSLGRWEVNSDEQVIGARPRAEES